MKVIGLGILLCIALSCTEAAKNERRKTPAEPTRTDQRNGTTDLEAPEVLKSQAYRDNGKEQLTYSKLTSEISANSTKYSYRTIPDMELDHDGEVTANELKQKNCGIVTGGVDTIKARRTNCQQVNGDDAIWSGEESGNSGEGNWLLVYKKDDVMVWQDATTTLLWATPAKAGTWNEASGAEVKEDEFICGNLKLLTPGEVKWMLPTRNEFLQADINGARFALPNVDEYYWTASRKDKSGKAWAIKQATGELREFGINQNKEVRCVGIPL